MSTSYGLGFDEGARRERQRLHREIGEHVDSIKADERWPTDFLFGQTVALKRLMGVLEAREER